MPGARPGSNPAQREKFQQRCRQIYCEDEHETSEAAVEESAAAGISIGVSDFEAMFPLLDPVLVRTLYTEAPTPQHAIETLLALSTPMIPKDDEKNVRRVILPPPRQLDVENHAQFPSLVDINRWQVVDELTLEEQPEKDLGSMWRDRAKAAAHIPAPRATPHPNVMAWRAGRHQCRPEKDEGCEGYLLPTDYELRQKAGERRARYRAQFGHGASGRAVGAGRDAQCVDKADEGSKGNEADDEDLS